MRTVTGSFFPAVGPADGDAALARSRAVSRRIALIGDSIAYGRCTHDGGWAALVASRHIARDEENNRFFNLAWPGATMLEILDAAGPEVASRRADTVLVAAGINDLIHADGRSGAHVGRDVIARLESFCAAMESQRRRGGEGCGLATQSHGQLREDRQPGSQLSVRDPEPGRR